MGLQTVTIPRTIGGTLIIQVDVEQPVIPTSTLGVALVSDALQGVTTVSDGLVGTCLLSDTDEE